MQKDNLVNRTSKQTGGLIAAMAVAGCLAAAHPAAAAPVTTLPESVAQAFPLVSAASVTGPQRFGDGVTYTATNLAGVPTSSRFGSTRSFTFATAGAGTNWGGAEPYAAFGLTDGVMNFAFDAPVAGVLTELVWSNAIGKTLTMSAYGASGQLLERLSFNADDPNYAAGFYGFERAANDISRFEIQGYYFGARNLSTFTTDAVAAVPEPATWAMMILGFGLAGTALRRRRSHGFAAA
ncbi:hypothetical protein ASE17_13960 [Phenylobacterium sp. Root77]|jgi:hypothetical protein|uniref:PEPxxWA-CTERM sorting domain-containing protein n=1 Tax=unclassified Phenylobacterium TaxID=2640670 RepID=UPI0006F3D869|nr:MULTISPECIES: PEPxxWA-CTERM sorting domain-containing protein [unclassified Phenylobacterium]KQW65915.1 hypothetical protein ASC73_19530 [Phenylobacterium sp. Root1277]KQW95624.1 hypothetical protein ASC79_08010 [Phenylobacterium sp. Root1290]KRC41413.1 hypothetical protein ASE17_13960 [Phenylobacterium sp. Root77]